MDICKNLNTIKQFDKCVLTIGSFDGMHCGHIEIIKELKLRSDKKKCPSIVISFDPHPKCIVEETGEDKWKVLMSTDKKLEVLKRYGIDYVWLVPFDLDFAQITAQNFLDMYIMKFFNPQDIVVGYDHHFGHKRKGDAEFLKKNKVRYAFDLHIKSPICINNTPVNSTIIRSYLKQGELELANDYLGWNYELCGIVVKGEGIGSNMKFPTANIEPIIDNQLIPGKGVYCVDVIVEQCQYPGMCNIGVRPTFYTNRDATIEVHLISDERLSLYDKNIKINFKRFIRKEKKYKNAVELANQLQIDRHICFPN